MTKCKCVFLVFGLPIVIYLVVFLFYFIKFSVNKLGYDCDVTKASVILGTAITIITLIKGLCEYLEHVKRQRIQYLLDMGRKYSANENITNVVRCLEKLSTKEEKDKKTTIRNTELDIHDIEMFMRFIEELQMLIDAHVVNESATLYLFGFYVKTFDEHHIRFEKLDDYGEAHWGAFMKFVKNVKNSDFKYKDVTL